MAPEDLPALTPASPDDSGLTRVGRYDLIERIGTGGMGVVYRGRDTMIGRPVAVKMLVSDIDVSDEARERFFREARAAGQLTHRNIITIYDFGEESGRAYIVCVQYRENERLLAERQARVETRPRKSRRLRSCASCRCFRIAAPTCSRWCRCAGPKSSKS